MITASFVIPAAHPSFTGHFPGRPVVPGVVTLDHVVQGLIVQIPGAQLYGFPQVKFMKPVLPEMQITVSYSLKKSLLYQFSCEGDGELVLTGQLQLRVTETCDGN